MRGSRRTDRAPGRAALATAGLLAALLLTACGSSAKSTDTGSGAGAGSSTTQATRSSQGGSTISSDAACKLVTQSEAAGLFGSPANQIADSSGSPLAKSVCLWSAKPTDRISYLLQVRMYDRPAFYAGNAAGYTALAGVGDKAGMSVLPGGSTIMVSYQKGDTVVAMSYSVHDLSGSGARKTAQAQQDQFVALVKQAAAR